MKTFTEWLNENLGSMVTGAIPGTKAIPVASTGGQASLSQYADRVNDPNWHHLYDLFTQRNGRDQELGQALMQAATSNNMSVLEPFVKKHLQAQRF